MYLLIPGRHHVLTTFQFQYLYSFAQLGMAWGRSRSGGYLPQGKLDGVIFAVTSANHSGTRRNPLPLLMRALQIHGFSRDLGVPVYVYAIPDVGTRDDFPEFVCKTIGHESMGALVLEPGNTVVAGSTPAMDQWHVAGFEIYPAEAGEPHPGMPQAVQPWDLVERIAKFGLEDADVVFATHPGSLAVWKQYGLAERVATIFADPLAGSDGDITATRDYRTYVQQMDDIADLKFKDTVDFIRPGTVGDIGCAVGSWLRLASNAKNLVDSDFYGIELARPLFEICKQRKDNGEFGTPHVYFSQRNAVTGLCFAASRMDTIHTGSLTHEIWSYGSPEALEQFIANRAQELALGGVWINRDVVGCSRPLDPVWIALDCTGSSELYLGDTSDGAKRAEVKAALDAMSTATKLRQFDRDFLPGKGSLGPGESRVTSLGIRDGKELFKCSRGFAQDFLMHKDFTDNWASEMHETFTFWSFDDWKAAVARAGLVVAPGSREFTSDWICDNRWSKFASLWADEACTKQEPWFPTTMVLVAKRDS